MAKSTERHKREKLSVIGKSMAVSAESIRRAGVVKRAFADGEKALMSGEHGKLNTLYKLAQGDNRAGLHILIPPKLRQAIKRAAKERGITVNDLLTETLTKIFWDA